MRVVSPQRVCIDTSELFPFTIMDVLLTLAENLLFTWVWTDDLLDERERVIVEHNHRTPESARSVINAVREWFASGRIEPGLYRDRITDALSPDPDDRAHIAACLDGRAQVILTRNVKDFAAEALQADSIVVMTADDYLLGLLARRPTDVVQAFQATAAARWRPAITACELADRVDRAGAPRFAEHMRRRLGCAE